MADDIVTRLRAQPFKDYVIKNRVVVQISNPFKEAADEIERLRAEVRALETERDQWQRMANRD